MSTANDQGLTITLQTLQGTLKYTMTNIGVHAGLLYTLKAEQLIHKIGATVGYQKGFAKASDDRLYNNAALPITFCTQHCTGLSLR